MMADTPDGSGHPDLDGFDAPEIGDGVLVDRLGRPLRDLRISVTDRCNFRCRYCMPREVFGPDFAFLPRTEILAFEEIERLARLFAARGVRKFRLTGGEPTLRADLPVLVRMLKAIPGSEVAMTTNGTLLKSQAAALAAAGLDRVTVSLDSLDDATFRAMNDMDFPVALVLEGIEAAVAAGLGPVKVNAVVRKGVNDHTTLDLARHFRGTPHTLRFIEFMDVGNSNGWKMDEVLPAADLARAIDAEWPLEAVGPAYLGEVAQRYRYRDGAGEVGFITSVTQPFCGTCTRARLSAEGSVYTCLFASEGVDLRGALRRGDTDEAIGALIDATWRARDDRYSELRTAGTAGLKKVEMSYIGG
ncbi:MAG: GTP 3',8-cyclase MoaA [Dehalococcoidia bacterium]|nr:GTP 3',8-cyclase MoaA [Dehalococcoidia bacterium]